MRITIVLAGAILTSLTATAAPPKLESLFPPGGARGTTVSVAAGGSFDRWPVSSWVDGTRLRVTAEPEKGKLQIAIDPQTEPGTYWLRLHDEEGATAPRPFVVGVLPDIAEVEPNDSPAKPQSLPGSATINGRLAKNGDVDGYGLTLKKGETVVASLLASRTLGSPMDGVLQICTPDGFVLDHNDDAYGLDPLIVFTAPRDGTYIVRVFAFPAVADASITFAGKDTFVYRLTITTGGFVDVALPLAVRAGQPTELEFRGWNLADSARRASVSPVERATTWLAFAPDASGSLRLPVCDPHTHVATWSADSAGSVMLPAVVSGVLAPRARHVIPFAGRKGQRLALKLESRSLGYPVDGVLTVLDAAGKPLATNDDAGNSRDPELLFTVPADGDYRVTVSDLYGHGGPRFAYRLNVREVAADFALTLAADAFSLTTASPLEIPVTIDRQQGFAQEIEVVAASLPDGVSCEPVKSLMGGDSAKSVKLKLTATRAGVSGPFQIVGRTAEPARERFAAFSLTGFEDFPAKKPWLTVTK